MTPEEIHAMSDRTVSRKVTDRELLQAIDGTEWPDTSVREVVDAIEPDMNTHSVAKRLRKLRDQGAIEVTRNVGSGKLYRVCDGVDPDDPGYDWEDRR